MARAANQKLKCLYLWQFLLKIPMRSTPPPSPK